MGHFRGTIKGYRGEASRLGSERSGLTAHIASWRGAVSVHLYVQNGVDYAKVELVPHFGRGRNVPLYDGPISGESDLPDGKLGAKNV